MSSVGDRLREVLGGDDLRWIVDRLVQRLERGQSLGGSVSLKNPSPQQRRAVDRLFGRPPSRGATVVADLDLLELRLREAALADSIAGAVQQLVGPVTNRRAREDEWQHQFRTIIDHARARLSDHPGSRSLREHLADTRTQAVIKRLSARDPALAQHLIDGLVRVLERLPAAGLPRAELASQLFGDSHALDEGRALSTLVTGALRALSGQTGRPSRMDRRVLWAEFGVFWDTLSAPVLTLNLDARGDSFTARQLALHRATAEPARLSVRQLQRDLPHTTFVTPHGSVFACENPAVLTAAAERLGTRSAPLICLEGQPRTAARLLLGALREQGIVLHYHGDFDWAGITIANLMVREYSATPWRMKTGDYRGAPAGLTLDGQPVEALWDADLATAMVDKGVCVHEEGVLDTLLDDLRG